MSTTDSPIKWEAAAEVAASFISLIADLSDLSPVRVFGALRQQLPVSRVDIALYTTHPQAFSARLTQLIQDGLCVRHGTAILFEGLPFHLLIVTR